MRIFMQTISSTSKKRLEEQGFRGYSDEEISKLRFGIRFAYVLCGTIVLIGLVFKSMPVLYVSFGIAFLGSFLPNHPLDYLYNSIFRRMVNRPKLPPRAIQARFTCTMATLMLAGIIYFFYRGMDTVAYIIGAGLLMSATMVSAFDLCLPSKIYNAIFERRDVKQRQTA
jgi:hypothetical protein